MATESRLESTYCEACGHDLSDGANWHVTTSSPGVQVLDANVDLPGEGPYPVCDACWREISDLIAQDGQQTAIERWGPSKRSESDP